MPVERWMTSARAVTVLMRAGADVQAARLIVARAVADHGRRGGGPRSGYVPVWLVADLAEVVGRLVAGESLDDLEAGAGDC